MTGLIADLKTASSAGAVSFFAWNARAPARASLTADLCQTSKNFLYIPRTRAYHLSLQPRVVEALTGLTPLPQSLKFDLHRKGSPLPDLPLE